MAPSESGRLTAGLCRAKAQECVQLSGETLSALQRIMLEHIANTWQRIADSLPANDA